MQSKKSYILAGDGLASLERNQKEIGTENDLTFSLETPQSSIEKTKNSFLKIAMRQGSGHQETIGDASYINMFRF